MIIHFITFYQFIFGVNGGNVVFAMHDIMKTIGIRLIGYVGESNKMF